MLDRAGAILYAHSLADQHQRWYSVWLDTTDNTYYVVSNESELPRIDLTHIASISPKRKIEFNV